MESFIYSERRLLREGSLLLKGAKHMKAQAFLQAVGQEIKLLYLTCMCAFILALLQRKLLITE